MTKDAEAQDAGGEQLFGDELPKGTELLRGQYRIARFLNAGGFGITYLARDSLDRVVVIKECYPANLCFRSASATVAVRQSGAEMEFESIVKLFEQEARALAQLNHPNIVGVHQVFQDNNTAYMALDFVRGQDLLDIIEQDKKRLSPRLIKSVLIKSLGAVAFIHDHGMLHRDISPDNILLNQFDEPVLIDFGAARVAAKRVSRVLSTLHTVKDGYSPQEFYLSGSEQSPASDLYALAATFYHLITGAAPPVSQERLSAVAESRPDPYVPLTKCAKGYETHFLMALDKALEIFPKDRIQSATEWLEEIDPDQREQRARQEAATDEELKATIRALVEETNKIVMDAQKSGKKAAGGKAPQNGAATPKKRVPLFPDLMGPPPKSDGRKASERHDERDVPSHPSVAPGSAADEAYLAGATQPRRLLNKVLNVSLWRLGRQNQPSDEIVGKVDR